MTEEQVERKRKELAEMIERAIDIMARRRLNREKDPRFTGIAGLVEPPKDASP
jgi:hypothetical protein